MKTPMKKIFIVLFLVSLFAVGCVTTKANVAKVSCPPENVIFPLSTPMGLVPLMIEKGFLNEENEGSNWVTEDEYNRILMEDEERPQSEEKDFEHNYEGQSVDKT